ncbi:ATP-grasp domain-containing protein [Streptomyces sp. MB09-01]|uniref:ATP-grasp domain-containing protein n=1 Tax=Streptomyces sp. MB09-01 TaxID=3028666 RepID=UPI003A5C64C4
MDKAALRARSNALHPVRPVSFARCGRADTLPFVTGLIGYPCVVKPRAGAYGEGVRLVRDEAEARAAAHGYPEVTDLLVEEYLEGPELTVEAHSRAGRHRILGWARRLTAPGPHAPTPPPPAPHPPPAHRPPPCPPPHPPPTPAPPSRGGWGRGAPPASPGPAGGGPPPPAGASISL